MVAKAEPLGNTEPNARIFISYSRKDMAFVDRLEAALKARGFEPLIDRTEIYAFEDWWKRIETLIGRADTIVFVLSPDAVASDMALKEVAHAASLNKRAGTQTTYPWGDEGGASRANCNGCGSRWDNTQPAPVGSFAPNQFGLYDMVGNVWEWVEDCYHSNYNEAPANGSPWVKDGNCNFRMVRGGAFGDNLGSVRSASRLDGTTGFRFVSVGFRVARALGP